jgi:transcriptional regulator with XRE-family HTH domain
MEAIMQKLNVIDYIVQNTDLKQKDIAEKLGVSRAQISKWKAGEFIPFQRHKDLNEIAGLFGNSFETAVLFKTEANYEAWVSYVVELSEYSDFYLSDQIEDEPDLFIHSLISILSDLGFNIENFKPQVSNIIGEDKEIVFSNLDTFIIQCIEHTSILHNWFYTFIEINGAFEDLHDEICELREGAQSIALKHIDEDLISAVGINPELLNNYLAELDSTVRKNLSVLCRFMNANGIPLMTDYFDYINKDMIYLADQTISAIELQKLSSDAFLPYADQLILTELRKNNELLTTIISQLKA